ncbi:MAG: DUF3662 domain-containing protein [Anaerolineae bacterium]|nr:DUF3662 domain-containing protein [Anaerolineae bacterium]MCX8066656.1 DUF3662 domain-containing protein [Anaerolineae bacterium]MDW7991050.1 DUF3662 domain-containing protein [Anaerolineae bacterium]
MNRLARFERVAEQLVEGTFARLFADRLHPLEVAAHLARAIEDALENPPPSLKAVSPLPAPTHYQIFLHPSDLAALTDQAGLVEELTRYLTRLVAQAGLPLTAPPTLSLEPASDQPPHTVRARASWRDLGEGEDTHSLATERAAGEEEPERTAFLIIGGKRQVLLQGAVLHIGRALDNDIILEDPRVSRHHAQLRRRFGRYVLYDLGSSGGTTVNGFPVQECVLRPGDVISFAGLEAVYGEEAPSSGEGAESETVSTRPFGGEEANAAG